MAAALGILAVIGGFYYLDWRNREFAREVEAEYLNIFRKAHDAAQHRRFGDELDSFVVEEAAARTDLVIWGAQYIRPGKYIYRAGNADEIELPEVIPTVPFATHGTRHSPSGKTEIFQTRGKAALIESVEKQPGTGEKQPIVIFVGRDLTGDAAQVRTIVYAGAAVLGGVAVFVFFSALLTAQFVWARIRDMSVAAEEIIRGDLSRRIRVGKRENEFDNLSATLNLMLDRNQKLLSGMKEVTDNIAHDLRTPLYRLKSRIELAIVNVEKDNAESDPRAALELALKEADKLLLTFNALLSIARLESGAMRDNLAVVDLTEVIRDVADLFEPAAEDRGLQLLTEIDGEVKIQANRALIAQALSNLVDNALKYSRGGGRVFISARRVAETRFHGATVDLVVADEGPGIAPADRERVLERFVRLDHGHGMPGSGLGLSLVSAIASLHEAKLSLEQTANSTGLTVRLRFNPA